MLERIPISYSTAAANAADRLRLLKCDLRLVDLALQGLALTGDDLDAMTMHLHRMIGDVESLADDILIADRKQQEGRE